MSSHPTDQLQRQQALNPDYSYIVQAPAGSGKTELLTQRYLVLLGQAVEVPEEIIAITFTRKAANEMRERIIHALNQAAIDDTPIENHQQNRYKLAKQVLKKDQQLNWQLLANPNRLRILTIDALCAGLAKHLPVLTGLGAQPKPTDYAAPYYQQAVWQTLSQIETDNELGINLRALLLHLGNNIPEIEKLFISMLKKRDQWLPYLVMDKSAVTNELRKHLQQSLQNIRQDHLYKIANALPKTILDEMIELASFAAMQLQAQQIDSLIIHCTTEQLPTFELTYFDYWQGIATLLLTTSGSWRKQITKTCGFPAPSNAKSTTEKALFKDYKLRMQQLLSELSHQETLHIALKELLIAPSAQYTDEQWDILQALIHVLPHLAAQLTVVFRQHATVDFVEVAMAANRALGYTDNPSDLALILDYQLKHILIDEFQDTSMTQFRLLEQLTAGWQPDDGRTLFVVGDPMQSIYRFREAEVGLFLRAKHEGIGDIHLESLTLSTNFRSTPTIVDWVNQIFADLMPTVEDITAGAVPYTSSTAALAQAQQSSVLCHPLVESNEENEAQYIIDLINQSLAINNKQSIAILVKRKADLIAIIPALQRAKLAYNAVDIDHLTDRPVIQDLYALTSALLHLDDRISWLTVLRAPWCGLALTDLHAIAHISEQHSNNETLWQRLQNPSVQQVLSQEGVLRIQHVITSLQSFINQPSSMPLHDRVYSAWLCLAGPATVTSTIDLEDAKAYFEFLTHLAYPDNTDPILIKQKLMQLLASPNTPTANIQLMTIHKAKGLEFDTVIIPALEKSPASNKAQLLLWLERPRELSAHHSDLILAPIRAAHDDHHPIYGYIKEVEKAKNEFERIRLLYVAATRAKQQLHLVGKVDINEENEYIEPNKRSFMGLLWPQFLTRLKQHDIPTANSIGNITSSPSVSRLTNNWYTPTYPLPRYVSIQTLTAQENIDDKSHLIARLIGTCIHGILQTISQQGMIKWQATKLTNQQALWQQQLLQQGMPKKHLQSSISIITQAIQRTLECSRGRWILDNQHSDSACELALTGFIAGQIQHVVIDRTFTHEGKRWVIDYKNPLLSTQAALNPDNYREQLAKYAMIVNNWQAEPLPIHLALYSPITGEWLSWPATIETKEVSI